MNKTDKRMLTTGIVVAELFGVTYFATHRQSELLLDALKTPIAEEKPYQTPDLSNPDKLPPVYTAFAEQYKPELVAASKAYNVPVEMIVGAIVEENASRTLLEDWKDKVALTWNACVPFSFEVDPSLGIGQVNVSTAAYLGEKYWHQDTERVSIEQDLLNPKESIDYIAMTLADIMHRSNRTTEGHIFDNPHLVSIIGTEYVRGPTNSPLASAQPTSAGTFYTWTISNIPAIRLFGEDAQITIEQQNNLRQYGKTAKYVE